MNASFSWLAVFILPMTAAQKSRKTSIFTWVLKSSKKSPIRIIRNCSSDLRFNRPHAAERPLSRIADRFQQQVHETEARLAPELQRIKKEFKGEQQAEEILALYKTERVHPLYSLKSLLGVAVVIPVFIGAFDMLAENIHLLNASFMWIADLSRPDALMKMPISLPFFGPDLNLLPHAA